ncbi:hypothetical protein A2Y85_05515 [candidate division WOR-3 bacterium RBG_13_43_14]|uniref:Major facilitator superfamily (MFS) profile domain-containing protein n=1 Tax=candidate division WOR-3 bacterium RBG_13_43_14 TaxID=1802590 RepID=A0A1F4UF67_UNCW3|nr:MAG: hypothetical protein A2Y85_05515 [candidate division WOR-3 bacterium RBG_13_43_14]
MKPFSDFKSNLLTRNLILVYSLASLGMLGHVLFEPLIPIFARILGASGFEVGLLTSGFMIARAAASYVIGRVSDHWQKRRIFIQIGFIFLCLITLSYILIRNYYGLLIMRFGQGICSGFIWPIAQIMVVEFSSPKYRTRALSLYQIMGRFGALLSRLFLSFILIIAVYFGLEEPNSFKLAFAAAGFILIIGLIISTKLPAVPPDRDRRKGEGRSPVIIFVLAFVFGAMMAMAPISLVYINEYFGLSTLSIAILLLLLDGLSMLAMYGASHLTDSIGIKNSLWFILIPCFVSAIALPFARSLLIFIIVYFILRMAISSFLPLSRSYATSDNSESGTNVGKLNMMSNIGSMIGPIIGGFLYDKLLGSYRISGYSLIALLLIPASIVLISMRRR